jgi:hypothetical protein
MRALGGRDGSQPGALEALSCLVVAIYPASPDDLMREP